MLSGSPFRNPSYVPTGRIWPSGDFSLGYKRVDGDSRVDTRNIRQLIDAGDLDLPERDGWSYGPYGVPQFDSAGVAGPLDGLPAEEDFWLGEPQPLDLTDARNSHNGGNRPEKYGKTGITGYGRKMVKSAATLIQKMPRKRITFATITMPALPEHQRRELALSWSEFVRQLLQTLTRWLKKAGLPPLVCSVSEIQPGRLSEYQEAYLHLHLVWPNHWAKSGCWAIDCCDLRAWCESFLRSRSLWCDGAWVNVDTHQVRKTAAGYLSKYMSKGTAEIEAFARDNGWDAVPGQWWNLTKPARDLVKKFTREGVAVGQLLEQCVEYVRSTGNLEGYHCLLQCTREEDGRTIGVGWIGILTQEHRKDLLRLLDNS